MRQAQQRFPELSRRVQLCPYQIKPPQAKQDWDQLWRLAHLLTQRVALGVGVLHLGGCKPLGHLQGRAEGDLQGQGSAGYASGVSGSVVSSSIPVVTVADGFQIGRAVAGLLPARCQ